MKKGTTTWKDETAVRIIKYYSLDEEGFMAVSLQLPFPIYSNNVLHTS